MKKILLPTLAFFLLSCESESIKEKINKAGDIAGQATGEFAEGLSQGVSKAFDVKLELSSDLQKAGLSLGKCSVLSDSVGTDNLLVVYVVFKEDFKKNILAKAFDEANNEMGRAKVSIEGKRDESLFIEFHFDKRTDIDSNSKLRLE